jgi:very-short-patch-repair endonuclease
VVSRRQLLDLGYSGEAIAHRLVTGRLHALTRGVYAVGRPAISQRGAWMAAVLSCGPGACASHLTAAAIFGIVERAGPVSHVSVPRGRFPRRAGLKIHRRRLPENDLTVHAGIPVTRPAPTLVDMATMLRAGPMEAAINEADKLDLISPDDLREALRSMRGRRGVAAVRRLVDRRTFVLTDSELERRFLRIARRVGLEMPVTGAVVNGYKIDFWWPKLGLVVETDGLRYHRTPAQQARDRERDQAHLAAGLTPLRFTHPQVFYEPRRVATILGAPSFAACGRKDVRRRSPRAARLASWFAGAHGSCAAASSRPA